MLRRPDEVPVREAPTPSESKRARPTQNCRNWRPVCWQCGRTGHLWRGCPRVICRRVQMVAAAAPEGQERAALRRGSLTTNQVEARQNNRSDSTGVTEGDRVRPYRPANREYRVIRDKARPGVTMRDKTCSTEKRVSRCKEHNRSDVIETWKSKLTKGDHP
jgi:hypothetical protein